MSKGGWVIKSPRNLLEEAPGISLFVLAIFTFLALWSYQATDPSLNTAGIIHKAVTSPTTPESTAAIHNYCGLLGSYLADFLLQIFGLSAFVMPFGLLTFGLHFLFQNMPGLGLWR